MTISDPGIVKGRRETRAFLCNNDRCCNPPLRPSSVNMPCGLVMHTYSPPLSNRGSFNQSAVVQLRWLRRERVRCYGSTVCHTSPKSGCFLKRSKPFCVICYLLFCHLGQETSAIVCSVQVRFRISHAFVLRLCGPIGPHFKSALGK